jgi:outer membrane protein TolC
MLIKLLLTFILCLCPLVSGAKLTLSDAENKAVSGSYEMRAAYFNEQAREWEKRNALSSYLPSVSYSAGYNRLDENTIERSPMMLFSPPGWHT